jgi:tetratricopeptide (TPR) repeat protein
MLAIAHRVGLDFDRVLGVRPGDEKLIAALADAALETRRTRAPSVAVRRWLLLGLAATLAIAGSAAAWSGALSFKNRAAQPAVPGVVVHRPPAVNSVAGAAPLGVAPVDSAEPTAVELSKAIPSNAPTAKWAIARAVAPRAVDEASAQFNAATAARRAGDFGRARSLYLQLELDFPNSFEAQLARVSLGKVLLVMGRAQEAEQQFALYLASGGSLTEEALLGRAQSLARLGRAPEEQRVWETLLRDFPASVYAAAARDRLSALRGARP